MQSLELVPYLAASTAISGIAMIAILRSWWKTRRLPTLLYTLAIACFSGMAIDLLLDQVYMPFTNWDIYIGEQRLWMSNVLLAFFIVGGFLFWYYAIMYSQYDSVPARGYVVAFMAGAALLGELEKMEWSEAIPVAIEALAFLLLAYEIVRYGMKVINVEEDPQRKRLIAVYFLGFFVWMIAGVFGVVIAGIPDVPEQIGNLWPIPYTLGLLMVAVTVAHNPKMLFISEARALDLLILDSEGTLVYNYRFRDYPDSVDPELIGSAMSGVISLMKEMLASESALDRVDHGDVRILVETGNLTRALLIVTKETPSLRQSVRNAMLEFEVNYRETLTSDTALVTTFKGFDERVSDIFE
ncbi:hypothetical protein EU538_08935 [Candidatus Thorarchaeota archaeon]|nr:MAG: hypothetical protein EU538_08935 [Candidatus Thorarchaeota archaeon]